jgi:hypothetical protein
MGLCPTASDRPTSDHPTENIFDQVRWEEWLSSNPVDFGSAATTSAFPSLLVVVWDHKTSHHAGSCHRQTTATVPPVYYRAASVCLGAASHLP